MNMNCTSTIKFYKVAEQYLDTLESSIKKNFTTAYLFPRCEFNHYKLNFGDLIRVSQRPKTKITHSQLLQSEMIIFGGYPVEEYKVQTSDNYILTMYRIPGGRNGKKFNPFLPPVVLVHGMISSSRDFLLMGPNKSIGGYNWMRRNQSKLISLNTLS